MTMKSLLLLFTGCGLVVAQEPVSLSGIVVDLPTGAPLANVEVRLIAGSMWEFKRVYGATTSRDGKFTIQEIIPGNYGISPELPGFLFPPPLRARTHLGEEPSTRDAIARKFRRASR